MIPGGGLPVPVSFDSPNLDADFAIFAGYFNASQCG